MTQGSQFRLLGQRRFLPFFGAQALGAFNDNVYKNVLVIVATYQAASYTQLEPELLTNIAGGLFILPYVLFSGIAGQLADRFDKALVLKVVKAAEIVIMAIAALGLRRAQHRGAARRAVPDGRAFDVLRAREVRPAAGGARKTRSWSAATRWSRWERSSRSCSARSRPACSRPKAASARSPRR